MKERSTVGFLREARSRCIERALRSQRSGDIEEKVRWEIRRQYVDDELHRFLSLEEESSVPRRVFISYSMGSGRTNFKILEETLQEARFEVSTGFDELRGTEGNVLRIILEQLKRSSIYIAILSQEMKVEVAASVRWAPGVWIMEEKGMALALGMPFVLLIDEAIHEDFWKKTAPHTAHVFFNSGNVLEKVKIVVQRVNDRYEELALKRLAGR